MNDEAFTPKGPEAPREERVPGLPGESFNLSIRKFLKQFGVGSQREIELAVQKAIESGTLQGTESLAATATLHIPQLGVEFTTESTITLS